MKVFGQYWFLQGLVTACMLVKISAACTAAADCNTPKGVCTDGKCVCKSDFAGPACASDNPCKSETCSNHGTCEPSEDATPVSVCTCDTGYTGTKCETEGVCSKDGKECLSGGKCETSKTPTTCTCASGYKGAICQNEGVCSKDGKECLNGGKCETSKTPTTCTCTSGYKGATCQNAGGTATISAYLLPLTVVTFFVIQYTTIPR
ncbi:sushi, nidogen and EGF-like domain-containing protein 1 isoform X2 [Haliotis rubra]|uniref:sushi, nidogen and EGF-like domain-containing protein 1 isoform X2 n=1 Tax=Haliotis rubra TaxID=36100 RepID=UPI001EE619E3|nr:sushi, nidogen and EGF-like domain-containing protein 1 isoform X2 [Haliotis rubra]